MDFENELKERLIELSKIHPNIVKNSLKQGDLIRKSRIYYEIDDPEIYKKFLKTETEKGVIPLYEIYNRLCPDDEKIEKFKEFGFKKSIYEIIVPFSNAINAGLGSCLEKAILVQLAAQEGRDSFLISGIRDTARNPDCRHAFNIVFKDGKPFLIDVQNPLYVERNGNIKPYTAKIIGISGKNWEFLVEKEWKQGRTYSLQ